MARLQQKRKRGEEGGGILVVEGGLRVRYKGARGVRRSQSCSLRLAVFAVASVQ